MSQYLTAKIKYSLAPYMIIVHQVDISDGLSLDDAECILDEFLNLDIDKALDIIDLFHIEPECINSTNIPMGGEDIDVLRMVPKYLNYSGISDRQLGLMLTNDPTKNPTAHRKFGEHYSKISCLLGLARRGKIDSRHKGYFETNLGIAFKKINSRDQQVKIITNLFLSIPIIQYLLYMGNIGKVNAYSVMSDDLSEVTKERRGHSLKTIFKTLRKLGNEQLNHRIDNIEYKEE